MEHGSVALVVLVCIVLLLVGGWVLYTYEVTTTSMNSEPSTPHQGSNTNWMTATATVQDTDITFQYPSLLPLATTETLYLITSPGYPNYSLPLIATNDIVSAEMTTDLKYIFYNKRDADNPQRLTLHQAIVASKVITKVTEYDLQLLKLLKEQQKLSDEQTGINPLVISNFMIYNEQLGDKVVGTIVNLENNTPLYTGPCGLDRRGNVSVSPDQSHIAWSCPHDGVYISDWKNTKRIVDFTDNINGTVISFVNNERVRFGDTKNEGDGLQTPYHSVNIDGTDRRIENNTL